jgi:GNAT superfamily N-acetyltransferase
MEFEIQAVTAEDAACRAGNRDPAAGTLAALRNGDPLARCTYQVRPYLHGVTGPSGVIGGYEARDAAAGAEVLRQACSRLAAAGVRRVLGPMEGSTWGRYRLALPPGPGDGAIDPPYFAGEPRNPADYPEHFTAAGFAPVAWYESRIDTSPGVERPRARELAARLQARGFEDRPLDLQRLEAELEALYHLSSEAFAENLYYSPIEPAEFLELYRPVLPLLDPDLVRLVHDPEGRLVAFLFAFPDPLSAVAGKPTRVVAKTVASAGDVRRLGLGTYLLDRVRAVAHEKGYGAVIHALMHVENLSMKTSARHDSRRFRRYALYEWKPAEAAGVPGA